MGNMGATSSSVDGMDSGQAHEDVVLRTDRLTHRIAAVTVVDHVSFRVARCGVTAISGPSGSGKSSLMRLLVRLDEPTEGTVFLDGVDYRAIPPRELRRRVAYVAQRPVLFPGTVGGNVAYGPRRRGVELQAPRIAELLADVGLDGFAERNPATLSGGEAQRACLARALANEPEVLLLDEPTSALDAAAKEDVERLIRRLTVDHDLTCLLVTHEAAQAVRLADRSVVMRDGRITEQRTR